jgi:peptidoglycan/xylan/chitin deacetylase (PgdA/CDA1 family)
MVETYRGRLDTAASPPIVRAATVGRAACAILGLASRLYLPACARGRLAILIYHRVLPGIDPMRTFEVDAATFDWHMQLVARYFTPLPLSEAIERLDTDSLPRRALCVTFDDGYADNHDVALPLLRRWNVPATFFVTTAHLNGGMMWSDGVIEALRFIPGDHVNLDDIGLGNHSLTDTKDRAAAALAILLKARYLHPRERLTLVERLTDSIGTLPVSRLMMTAEQIVALRAAGMEIGGHTVSHPILTQVADTEGWDEIVHNKEELESVLGEKLCLFAYPNGSPGKDYAARHIDMVKRAGYTAAVSTAWGAAASAVDRYQLPRVMPWDATAIRFGLRLLLCYGQDAELSALGA